MTVIKNLLTQIIDYAGLFPPASLSLEKVTENYAHYVDGRDAWMLARLVIPARRLAEFEALGHSTGAFNASATEWRLSAVVPEFEAADSAFSTSLASIAAFNEANVGAAIVDTIEVKAQTLDAVDVTISAIPTELQAFLEIPYGEDPSPYLAKIHQSDKKIYAKLRTGGINPDLIPTPTEVARFIAACARIDVGFKATAGLHHPLRGSYRLTYDPNPEMGTMFGFLNVFIAAAFAFAQQTPESQLEAVLTESDPGAFQFFDNQLGWHELAVSLDDVAIIREQRVISFGSCSFTEPTEELMHIGWLNTTEPV